MLARAESEKDLINKLEMEKVEKVETHRKNTPIRPALKCYGK